MENIIKAISVSFLHSIWQGLAIAAIAAVGMIYTKRSAPFFRYHLYCSFFILFICCFLYTFRFQYLLLEEDTYITLGSVSPAGQQTLHETNSFITNVVQWCAEHSIEIFCCWLLIFVIRTIIMVRSLMLLERIKNRYIFPVGAVWEEKFRKLAGALGLKLQIIFRQSAVVTQPMVIGILKPVLLVPIGFLNHLSMAETEAILLHELAHIKRRDFSINLLQSFFESIFFFNPALLWLSNQIRNEREYCCDETAVNTIGSRKRFIKALVAFQEYKPKVFAYSMAFGGHQSLLIKRVDRIIQQTTNSNIMTKTTFIFSNTLILLTLISFTALTSPGVPDKKPANGNIQGVFSDKVITANTGVANQQKPNEMKKTNGKLSSDKFLSSSATRDTIPKGASKEFIDGYNAGKNYKKENELNQEKIEKISEINNRQETINHVMQNEIRQHQTIQELKDEKKQIERNFKNEVILQPNQALQKQIETNLKNEVILQPNQASEQKIVKKQIEQEVQRLKQIK